MDNNLNLIKKNENLLDNIKIKNKLNSNLNINHIEEKENNNLSIEKNIIKQIHSNSSIKTKEVKKNLYMPLKQHLIDYKKLFNKVFLPKNEEEFLEINNIKPIKISIKDNIKNIFIDDAIKGKNNSLNKNKAKIKTKILNLNISKPLTDNQNNNKQMNYKNEIKTDRIIYDNNKLKKYSNNYYLPKILTKKSYTTENHMSNRNIFRNPRLHILNRINSQMNKKLPPIIKRNKQIKIKI